MFDQGRGEPLIVVPGIQGRWEWLTPSLRELARHFRTIAYTLRGDPGSGSRFDPALGFENYVRQIDDVFLQAGVAQASLCGISYGGFIALRYAALRPMRVKSLILVSSPAPGWEPNATQRRYVSRPWRSLPAFVASAPGRLWPEIRAAHDTWQARLAFSAAYSTRILAAPALPTHMAGRVTLEPSASFAADCARIVVPTLVVTGEDDLDRIVPPGITRRYLSLIPGAQYEKMERTGHLGLLTRPRRFAEIVSGFVNRCHPSQT